MIPGAVDITNFSREDLMRLAMSFQNRAMILSQYIEVQTAKMEGVQKENEALRKILSERIVTVLVEQPPEIPSVEEIIENAILVEEESEPEEEPTPAPDDVTEMKEKDKFQA